MAEKQGINCIVETPKGYGVKINYDPRLGGMELTKVLPAGLVFPFDFGYIPGTLGEDGDPLDVVIVSEFPSFPGCAIKCRIVGSINATQREKDGTRVRNDRYIAIPIVSVVYKSVKNPQGLPKDIVDQLQNFFINYNQQAGKKFRPLSLPGPAKAMAAIEKGRDAAKSTKLVQLLLPLCDEKAQPFPNHYYASVKETLVREFDGVTMYTQLPAVGIGKSEDNKIGKDTIVIFEVMTARIDRSFWEKYRQRLQKKFKQHELVIRQMDIGLL